MSRFRFRIWDKENLEMYDEAIVGNFPKTVPMVLVGGDWLHIEPKVCAVTYCDIDGSPYNNVLIREVKWKNSGYRLCENYSGTELSSSLTTKDIFSVKVIGNIYEGVKDGLS